MQDTEEMKEKKEKMKAIMICISQVQERSHRFKRDLPGLVISTEYFMASFKLFPGEEVPLCNNS